MLNKSGASGRSSVPLAFGPHLALDRTRARIPNHRALPARAGRNDFIGKLSLGGSAIISWRKTVGRLYSAHARGTNE